VISALVTPGRQRSAEQVRIVNEARNRFSPQDFSILERAATAPFQLNTEERMRLRELRNPPAVTETSTNVPESGTGLMGTRVAERLGQPSGGRIITTNAKLSTQRVSPGGTVTINDGDTQHEARVVEPARLGTQGRLLQQIARLFNKRLVAFESDTLQADGFVRDGDNESIYINAKSQMSVLAVFGHELTHQLKRDNPQAYAALEAVVRRELREGATAEFAQETGYDADASLEELTSDLVGNRFQEPDFWQSVFDEIAAQNPEGARGIITRLAAAINRAINAFRKFVTQPGFDSDQYVNDIDAVKKAVNQAMTAYMQQPRLAAEQTTEQAVAEVTREIQAAGKPSMAERLREAARTARTEMGETVTASKARRGGVVEQAGDFTIRTQKDGTLGVSGDPEAIRALLPEGIAGRAVPGGMVFTATAAPRVRAALEGRKLAYSRAGQVTEKLPMKDGKYVGAPEKFNTPGKITQLRKWLNKLAREGEAGRYWYENSSREVLAMVGGNVQEARKFVALLSIYSPQAKVDANSTFALRAWAQYKAGQPISVKTGVQDRKAQEALDNVDAFWSGEKTGNFFFNLLREIDPSTAGRQGATIDMWMMRAGQYSNDAPTATQYAFMENETNRLAQELGWEPQQVQAAIWVAMKARMENAGVKKRTEASSEKKGWIRYEYPLKNGKPRKTRVIVDAQKHRDNWLKHAFEHDPTKDDTQQAKFDFSDGLRRHVGQLSWEARPGRSTNVLPGVNDAPYEQQVEFQQAVQKALLDDNGVDLLAYKLGMLVDGPDILAPGVWQGEIAAGMQKLIALAPAKGDEGKTSIDPAQKKAIETYAAMLGLLLRQEGVGYHRPFYNSAKSANNGVDLVVGRTLSPAEAQSLWAAINDRMDAAGVENWENGAGMISSPTGMRVVNFGAVSDNIQFRDLVKDAASTLAIDEIELQSFSSDGDLVFNDWKESPNGENYRSRIREAYGPDLLEWAGTVLAPRVQSVFNEFSSRYGWGDPGRVDALFDQPAAAQDQAQLSRRRDQKNPDRSRVGDQSADRFLRTPELQQAVTDLQEGRITRAEYDRLVDELRPVYPYDEVPPLTTPEEARYALATGRGQSPEKAAKYGLPSQQLKKGDMAQLRLDIPSYQNHDAWVVSVHTPKSTNVDVQAAYDAGPVVGYESVGSLTDVYFGMNQNAALKIAQGTSKGTIATILGKWNPISNEQAKARAEEAINDPAWTQVGMDPFRHSYFYDRDTMQPVLRADEVIQIGPLVLAKNVQFGKDEDVTGAPFKYSRRRNPQVDTPEFKRWFGDSKVVDENGEPLVVYHGTSKDFDVFNTKSRSILLGSGAYFTADPIEADNFTMSQWPALYGATKPQIVPVYLSIKNPYEAESKVDPSAREDAIREEYDGIIVRGKEGRIEWAIAFEPTQIKSALGNQGTFDPSNPDIRFSRQRTGPFYSQLAEAIDQVPARLETQPAQQWKAWLASNASKLGIKKDEIEWSGINDYLDLRGKDKVTKAEIAEYLDDSGVEVGEVLRDDQLGEQLETKFDEFQLPGGQNYGELMLNLPDEVMKKLGLADYRVPQLHRYGDRKSDYNRLAHVRFNDRTDVDGNRVLFIEEIQSDWAQEGRKRGFAAQPNAARVEEINKRLRELAKADMENDPEWDALTEEKNALTKPGVSKAPFVQETKAWVALAVKRMLVFAARNGYDKIAFINGEQSADRYDLSKRIDDVYYRPESQTLIAMRYDTAVINKIVPADELPEFIGKDAAEKLLAAPVTKNLSGSSEQKLSGVDLKVGGKGMIKFYDEIVPQVVNDVLKKVGGKMDTVTLVTRVSDLDDDALNDASWAELKQLRDGGIKLTQPGFTITPEMRDKVEGGMPLFSRRRNYGSLTAAQEQALRNVGGIVPDQTVGDRMKELGGKFKKSWFSGIFDQFAPLKDVDQRAYMLARLSKGSDGALEALMLYGKPFMNGDVPDVNVNDEGFIEVMASLKGEHDRFLWWVAAQRAENIKANAQKAQARIATIDSSLAQLRQARKAATAAADYRSLEQQISTLEAERSRLENTGQENLFTDQDISSLKSLNQGNFEDGTPRAQAYANALAKMNDFNDAVLNIAEQSGLIDGQARQLFKDMPYVPFYRVMEDGVEGPSFSSGLVNQQAWKKLKGGTQKLNEDLLSNVLLNWAHLFDAAGKNRAAVASMQAATQIGIAQQVPAGTKGAVKVMEQGQTKHYTIDDPYIMEAVTALNYQPPGFFSPFSTFKKWLTIGVTASPTFKIKNLMRDSLQAIGTAPMSYNVASNVMKGFKKGSQETQTFASMLAGGGLIRFGSMLDGTNRTNYMIERQGGILLNEGGWKKLQRQMTGLVEAYAELGDRLENVNRVSLYEHLLSKGYSQAEANFMSRDLMDFSLQGRWPVVRFLAQSVPFLNARLQGLSKLGRGAKEDPRRFGYVVGAVAMASIALMLAYEDDEDWKKRPDWDRDTNWWFKIGDTAFRIPKPFEIGAIGTVAERTWEMAFNDEMTWKRYRARLSHMIFETFAMDPTPQLIVPIAEIYANREGFTGRPIEGMSLQKLRPEDRATESTSSVARMLGQMGLPNPVALVKGNYEKLSPVQIDHLVRGYFGWIGTTASNILDFGLRPLMDRGERPAYRLKDVFVVGNFAEGLPAGSSRYVDQLYDQARVIEQAYMSYRDAVKKGDRERARELMAEEGDKIRAYKAINKISDQVSEINRKIRQIDASRTLSAETKRKMIDQLSQRKNAIAKQSQRFSEID
jgi:hypothetical protein